MLAQIINAMFSIMFLGPLGFIVMAFAVLGSEGRVTRQGVGSFVTAGNACNNSFMCNANDC